MKFEEPVEFKRDLKLLLKKFRTLNDDLDVLKRVLEIHPDERPPFSSRIPDTGADSCTIKLRKIACRSLKDHGANSGLRLIYAWLQEKETIIFLELYHKNEKETENKSRISNRLK